ncbi:MAG: diguanylate cyclase [Candidatus Omnitrophica bacterium]|nr:diguanylate cyclase [Candidatus Omnitrophota bacterium]
MAKSCPSKILIVEDNQDHQLLIRNALARWVEESKSIVEFVSTVAEALDKLSSSNFDFVLTDYRLPDKTGLELLAEVKTRNLKFPILLMTSMGDEALAVNALKSGFIDYVVKSEGAFRDIPRIIEGAYEKYQTEERERKLQEEIANKNVELRSANQKLAELSVKDELTSLYNHRFFQEKMVEEFARAARYRYPLSCLMLDIDHFKAVNDTYGHLAGDAVLKALGNFFVSHLRQADTIARYGGEEFVILLPHVGYEGAHLLAERIRKKIMDQSFSASSALSLKISVSIGISSYPEDPVDRKETLVFYADKALYRAKGNGRNRVYLYRSMSKEYANKIPELKFNDEKVHQFRQRLFDVSEMAKRAYIEATKALINALEAKDQHTMGHAARVGYYSALVAREMGLGEDDVRIIEHAGLLHDIGKICIPDEILLKPGGYTHQEYEAMKQHPVLGYQIVKPIKFLAEEALIILHHHEWYNGEGYPHRLKGKEIPMGARVVSVLDAYDTMRAAGGRYERTLNCEEAVRELIEHARTQFDPEPVFHLVQVLLKRGDLQPHAYDHQKLEQSVKSIAA